MVISYIALVHKVHKKSATYGVMFPDFPGCVFAGKNLDEAIKNAREGLIFHMEGMLDAGEVLPEPSSLEVISKTIKDDAVMPCLVCVVPPTGNLKRINISIDSGLLVEIDHAAKALGKNRSEFLADAAKQILV